jgi:hypothetical protein
LSAAPPRFGRPSSFVSRSWSCRPRPVLALVDFSCSARQAVDSIVRSSSFRSEQGFAFSSFSAVRSLILIVSPVSVSPASGSFVRVSRAAVLRVTSAHDFLLVALLVLSPVKYFGSVAFLPVDSSPAWSKSLLLPSCYRLWLLFELEQLLSTAIVEFY